MMIYLSDDILSDDILIYDVLKVYTYQWEVYHLNYIFIHPDYIPIYVKQGKNKCGY